ncbi:MAG: TonB-dependent receptor [Bacteroidia bacterium]|nr:TonB-dependent receptor [Bacteroidia bacterium]
MFRFYIIAITIFFQQRLLGQITPSDSAVKSVQLEEVCVSEDSDNANQAFDFYKNSKLASTEDILSRMQGVNLIKRGAYGLEPTLRNYSTGQSNVTIDGMRIYGACTDKMDPVSIYIEPANLHSIQVAHGASGALDGSTIGGQIGMKLKEPTFSCHSKLNGQFSQSYLTVNNGYNSSLTLQQSYKKVAYRVSGTFRKADNYRAGSNTLIQHSEYQKLNTSAAISFKITQSQILKLDYIGDWGKNIGYPALPMDVGTASAQIFSLAHQLELRKGYFAKNNLKIYYNDIIHQMDDTRRIDAPMHMDMPGWSKTFGAFNELFGKNNFKLRVDYHHVYTRADMTMYPSGEAIMYMQTLPENYLNDIGIAINQSFNFKFKQQLNINGRIDYYNQYASKGIGSKQWKVYNTDVTETKTDFLKNFNLVYNKRVKETITAQFSVGYGERIPTSNERYGYYLFNRQDQFDYIGNLKLKPEQSYQMELLFKQQFKKVEYSVNFFYHHIQNYIYAYQLVGFSQMTIGAYGLKTYKNIDYATSQGFEVNLKAKITSQMSYIASAKYIYAQTDEGSPLPLIPPFKLQHALRYNYKLFQFQFEHDFAATQRRINSDYGDKVTPYFNLYNFRASRNLRIKSTVLQLTIACENILDANYREHLDIGGIPRFGRNFLMNLSFMF